MNIVETIKESAAGALSEHSFGGIIPPPPAANPDEYSALQTHLTDNGLLNFREINAVYGFNSYPDFDPYANMLAWFNTQDINATVWNTVSSGGWNPVSMNPEPDGFQIVKYFPQTTLGFGSVLAQVWGNPPNQRTGEYWLAKTQVAIDPAVLSPPCSAYMILVIDILSGAVLAGCTYPLPPGVVTVVNLPFPDIAMFPPTTPAPGFGGTVGIAYVLGLVGALNVGVYPNVAPDLNTWIANFYAPNGATVAATPNNQYFFFGYGYNLPSGPLTTEPGYNAGLACLAPSGPPF